MSDPDEIVYERGSLSAGDLQRALSEFFSELHGDPTIERDAAAAGIDVQHVSRVGKSAITVEGRRPGLTGVEEIIVIAIVTELTSSVWRDLALPWLKRRFGGKVVGEERKDES